MKFARISLAIILSLLLIGLICPAVQASEESGSVDLSATVALVISDVSASSIGYHGATISWKTNGDATSQVFYDTVSHDIIADYAYHPDEDTTLITEHSVRLTGLSSGTTYHYRVKSSIPETDFIAISDDYTFRTSTPGGGGGGGGGAPTYYIETDLLGTEDSFRTSRTGEILETIEATSTDGMLAVSIPKGTIAKDENDKRLRSLEMTVDEDPPLPPEDANIIGLAYNFGPDGATFDPPITFTWSYDPEALPEGVAEEDLVLAYYDEETGEWVELDCVVDTENNIITASVPHFTTFAIIGTVTPPPPPAPSVFSLSNLSIQPAEVEPSEAVSISVSVANTGGSEGSYSVILKINGVEEAQKSITIVAGSSEIATFSVIREEVGNYTVTVDGLSDSFTVVTPEEEEAPPSEPVPSPINWPLIGGIVGGLIAVSLLVYFLVVRRRVAQER